MAKTKNKVIDMTLINVNPEIYPRARVDEDLVETYRQNIEAGIEFPPLVVQKATYTLIDGRHRLEALRNLEEKIDKVKVEIRDLPDNELRAEAIRLNTKHGKRLTKKELRRNIIDLRFQDQKSLKEIAKIVGKTEARVSQVCQEYEFASRYFDDFNNLNPKVPKIDLRVKVGADKKEEIIKDIDANLSGKEIAEKYNVSQSLVSQIKKEREEWASSPVYIKMDITSAYNMFVIAFMNRVLKKVRLEFKDKGVVIRNAKGRNPPYVVALFKNEFFWEYKVKKPIEGYVRADFLTQLKNIDVDLDPTIELAMVDPKTWKIRYEKGVKKHEYTDLDWRKFPIGYPELDTDGIPTTCTVKAEISPLALPRNQKGELTLVMQDKELSCSFKCNYDWDCNQKVKLISLVKTSNATAVVDLETLDQVLKGFRLAFWIGMWSDRTNLAMGRSWSTSKFCFII